MSANYFNAELGFSLGDDNAIIFFGADTTALNGLTTTTHPIGSLFLDNTTGLAYSRKFAITNNSLDWSASEDPGSSWREPALVRDATLYADIGAAQTAANVADTVDGQTIALDDRLLFTNLTSGNNNVYIVEGSSGAWTFKEDTNTATKSDILQILEGTDQGYNYTYNGTAWILSDTGANTNELGFIRNFVGKTAGGTETPTFSSINVLTQNSNLEVAIGQLDSTFGDGSIAATVASHVLSDDLIWATGGTLTLTAAINSINSGIGGRVYTASNILTTGDDISTSLESLNVALGDGNINSVSASHALDGDLVWNGGTLTVTSALDQLNDSVGDRNYTQSNYVTVGEDLTSSIDALDLALFANAPIVTTASNVNATAGVVVDVVPHGGEATEVRWMVIVRETSDTTRLESFEIHGLTDGVSLSDHTVYARLNTGGKVQGIKFNANADGTNVNLTVEADNNIDYTVNRIRTVSLV